jgi:hypothetical protein
MLSPNRYASLGLLIFRPAVCEETQDFAGDPKIALIAEKMGTSINAIIKDSIEKRLEAIS